MIQNPFEDLFVLELANNHWGSLDRGLKIISDYSEIVRQNGIHAAIKLQFREMETFVHKNYRHRRDLRYIKKTLDTQLKKSEYIELVKAIQAGGCIPMTTPFDEKSVDFVDELGMPIIKISSADINDWQLLKRIAQSKKPVICSTGGSTLQDVDDLMNYFLGLGIPIAINHCVSIYPSEDHELELNQIDFLKARYPGVTVGFSTHEYRNWEWSVMMAYAKGARTFERHIDIDEGGMKVPAYNSLPHQIDQWFRAFRKAKEMCGAPGDRKRVPPAKEIAYLDKLLRGVFVKKSVPKGHPITKDDIYLSVPLLRGQISCRELKEGEQLLRAIEADEPVMIDDIDSPYARDEALKALIHGRGLDPKAPMGNEFEHGTQAVENIAWSHPVEVAIRRELV